MAPITPSSWLFTTCMRCMRQPAGVNGPARRLISSAAVLHEEFETQPMATKPSPPLLPPGIPRTIALNVNTSEIPEYMQKWGILDPTMVEDKKQERRLIRRDRIQPVGSRRRRAVLRRSALKKTAEIPFEQLPYQCFQEARRFLLEDRNEKLKEIETQQLRIKNLVAQDPTISGGVPEKETRLRRMREHLHKLIILADINDPIVKRKFEDGEGDMSKPIYRYLAEQKWRKYKRLVQEQRNTQMHVIPDLLPKLDLTVDIDLGFGRKLVGPGEFVDSAVSESMPRLNVQSFTGGEKLVTVVVVDGDVPIPENDTFTHRCHFIASNIRISPSETSIPFQRIAQEDRKVTDPSARRIGLPWLAPWAHKGAPYHRLVIFILEQTEARPIDVTTFGQIKREGFNLRSFVNLHRMHPLGATMFRTKWDDKMPGVMCRLGLEDQINIEFKPKRIEPLPYRRRTERMR